MIDTSGECWLLVGHVQRWLQGTWPELPPPQRSHTAACFTLRCLVGTRSNCIPNGPAWLRNSWRAKTPRILSGTRRRVWTSSPCTRRQTRLAAQMSCLGCSRSLEGPIPPCTPTDPGPSGSTLASAQWRRATSFIKTTSKVFILYFKI